MSGINRTSTTTFTGPRYINPIKPGISEGRRISPKRVDEPTAIPLTNSDEENNTTKYFVNPGIILTINAPVTGEYKNDGSFEHRWKLLYTHYAVQGKFTDSSGKEQETELIIPRKVIEERFHFA